MFDPKNLHVMAYAVGATQWLYKTRDSRREVTEPGYFKAYYNTDPNAVVFRCGDWIQVQASIAGKIDDPDSCDAFLITVASNSAGEQISRALYPSPRYYAAVEDEVA